MRIQPKKTSSYPWPIRWLFRNQKRRYGQVFVPAKVWGRSPRLLLCMTLFWAALTRKRSPIEPHLRALVCTRVSQLYKCAFCLDLHSSLVANEQQLAALSSFRGSPLFSRRERLALAYIEDRSSELFEQLKMEFSDDEIVELTGLIAYQTCSVTFNSALDLQAQGFHS